MEPLQRTPKRVLKKTQIVVKGSIIPQVGVQACTRNYVEVSAGN